MMTQQQLSRLATALFYRVGARGYEALSEQENVILHTVACVSFMSGCEDFADFFDSGFDAEDAAECLDIIGCPYAAEMVRQARRMYRSDRQHPALDVSGRALARLESSIYARLRIYADTR